MRYIYLVVERWKHLDAIYGAFSIREIKLNDTTDVDQIIDLSTI